MEEGGAYEHILVVGAGAMAVEHHVPRLLGLLGASEVEIFDVDRERRHQLERRFRKNRRIRVASALPASGTYDLVVVATAPKSHCEIYRQLETQTSAILVEKPLSINTHEGEVIEASALAANKKVFVNLFRRTLWSFPWIKTLHRNGVFGSLRSVTIAEGGVFSWRAVSMGPFSRELSGGGVLMDVGPHTIDLLFQVFDRLDLRAAWMDCVDGTIEANCRLSLVADSAIPVTLSLSRNRQFSNRAVFEFAGATLSASVRDNTIDVMIDGAEPCTVVPPGVAGSKPTTFAELNDAFYREFLIPRDNSSVSPTESLKGLRIIDRAYEIAESFQGGF